MTLLIGASTIGLILALLALGVYLSFRIFNFPDITADGSITLGAAVTATLLVRHVQPELATLAGFAAGVVAGTTTGVLHTKFKINGLLSGILVMTALYSVNLHVMGKSNVPLLNESTMASQAESLGLKWFRSAADLDVFGWTVGMRDAATLLGMLALVSLLGLVLYLFFRTNLGTAMRATGDNPQMIRALGVSVDFIIILGLALSNGLIALSGSLLAQYQGFADVQMGIGMVVWGLAILIIGTNGSGKSTLLNAVAGTFLPDVGRLTLAGQNITRWPEHRRAKLIGRVFQNPFSGTTRNMSIAENLAMAARRGHPRGFGWALNRKLRESLRDRIRTLNMGLENRLDNAIGSLSGGQRQALTLLMASWLKPELLLLDEHTAALDPKSADQVIRLTHEIIQRDKLTTLMVTHSMQQAVHLGDRIVMMHRGQVLHDLQGAERARVRPEDLLKRFDEVRRREQLDPTVAEMLQRNYV